MSAKRVILAVSLLAGGYARLQPLTERAQNNSPLKPPTSLKELQENSSLYFPPGTFKKPDGSADGRDGDGIAWYLREIGEPPLSGSDKTSEVHAYRLIRIGFPSGTTMVIRLQIDSLGTAKIFAKKTPFNGTNFLLNKTDSVSVAAVNEFLECVKRGDFWQLPTKVQAEPNVKDGSYWYLEGLRHGEYHMVYRRNPESNPGSFTDIGRYLALDLANLGNSVNIPRGDRLEPLRR
jgi:hypothetical protein